MIFLIVPKENSSKPRRLGRPPKGTRGDTRQKLLDAALALFAEQGYAATPVRQIADEVDVRNSAIYVHFDSKREILDALLSEAGPAFLGRLRLDLTEFTASNPRIALPQLFEAAVDAWEESRARQLLSLMIREGFATEGAVLGGLGTVLEAPIERWVSVGHFRDDFSTDTLLWELTAPIAAARMLYLHVRATPTDRATARKLIREHIAYFVETVSA